MDRIQMVLDEKPQITVTMEGAFIGDPLDIWMRRKDGWMYSRQGGASCKIDASEALDSILDSCQRLLEAGT